MTADAPLRGAVAVRARGRPAPGDRGAVARRRSTACASRPSRASPARARPPRSPGWSSSSSARRSSSSRTSHSPHSSPPSCATCSPTTAWSSSSRTTTTTSPRRTSRGRTPTSRRTRRSTTRSTGCATPRPPRCSRAATRSSSHRSRASTGWVRPRSTARRWSSLVAGEEFEQRALLRRLVEMHYVRNDMTLLRGTFRVQGRHHRAPPELRAGGHPTLVLRRHARADRAVRPADRRRPDDRRGPRRLRGVALRRGDETMARAISSIEAELQVRLAEFQSEDKLLEVQRLRARTEHDLEMLAETGTCAGIENYSRHLDGRAAGGAALHAARLLPRGLPRRRRRVPRGGPAAQRAVRRRQVPQGRPRRARLPAARQRSTTARCASRSSSTASPRSSSSRRRRAPTSAQVSDAIVEQVIRPTGLVDPARRDRADARPDRRPARADRRHRRGRRPRARHHAHQEDGRGPHHVPRRRRRPGPVPALRHRHDRAHRDPPLAAPGEFDVLVGINLLREGLDLPEVGLVAILDADKEGFLRSSVLAHPDHRPRGAQRAGPRRALRRHHHRLDAHRASRPPSGAARRSSRTTRRNGSTPSRSPRR